MMNDLLEAAMTIPTLHIDGLAKTYPAGFTLKISRLKIEAGELVGLVGNNGAGKTTLMLLALGLLARDAGSARIYGVDVAKNGAWRRRTASYLGESSLISFLNPSEYWAFVGAAYGLNGEDVSMRLSAYEDFLRLAVGERRKLIREFSTGTRKKIGLVAAFLARPDFLILDEPFAGLDPRSQSALKEVLDELNRSHGLTLFISSHDLSQLVEICRRIIVLADGRVVQDAPVCAGSLRNLTQYLTQIPDSEKASGKPSNPVVSR